MKKTKKSIVLVIVLMIIGICVYMLYPKSASFDSFIFKNINKSNISQIIISDTHSVEDKKIENKEQVQLILTQLEKINIKESNKYSPDKGTKAFDIDFSGGNNNISFGNTKGISDVQITYYDTGYITLQREGTLKNKYYKIINESDIKYINNTFENLT